MATRKTKTTTASKKNPWRSTHVPLPSWIMFWALVLCTMALIVVNFNKAFSPAPVEAIDDTTAAQFAAIRASLEQQVSDLQTQANQLTSASSNGCDAVSTPGPADSRVLYVDPKTKVSMSLPYSSSWGNGCAPFKVTESGVSFGPLDGPGNFDSAIEIHKPGEETATSTKKAFMSGLTVYQFEGNSNHVWIAVGRSFTYKIFSEGWLTDSEVAKIIQSLKVTK